jgi:hypothetical protein
MNRTLHSLLLFPAVVVLGLGMLGVRQCRACSICRCGDATFNALGKSGYTSSGLRFALDWERFDKTEGDPDDAESQVENRETLFASYGVAEWFRVSMRVPYSSRELTEEGESLETNGFSDPEFYGQVRVWASPWSELGHRASVSLTAGIKTPWGRNRLTEDGERLDEHGQPGTGATDLFGSVSGLYLLDSQSAIFGSVGYRHTGTNDHDYRYGRTVLANLAYEHKLGRILDGVLELNFRHAAKDRIDAAKTKDPDTGGSLLYLTPRLLVDLGHGVVLRGAVQIPVAKNLNGAQKERAVADVGLTWILL